ncbi:MAG: glycosyltransferase [Arcticibacter sp.]
MIFVTIGTQEPFDRLVRCMDKVVAELDAVEAVAQVSHTEYPIRNMKAFSFLAPQEFSKQFSEADLIVSHAGMGTIISAMKLEKPIIIFPRLAELGEHRNDHQLATARVLDKLKYLHVAYDEETLRRMVHDFIGGKLKSLHRIGDCASPELIGSIRQYIEV